MADYKGLNIKWEADSTSATKALYEISQQAKAAYGQLTGIDQSLKNVATNGKALNDALQTRQLEKVGDAAKAARDKLGAYNDVLQESQAKYDGIKAKLDATRASLEAMPERYEGLAQSAQQSFAKVVAAQDEVVAATERVRAARETLEQVTERGLHADDQQSWVQSVNDQVDAYNRLRDAEQAQQDAQRDLSAAVAEGDDMLE